MTNYPVLTKEIVSEILQSSPPYSNDEEKETCRRMVEALTDEERNTAACTSYAYWFALTHDEQTTPTADDEIRMATREARRHLVASINDEEVAMERLRETCRFRKERGLDLFRVLYPTTNTTMKEGSPEEEELKAKYRAYIEEELNTKQLFFVRGKDRENRAVAVKMGRTSPETTPEAYELMQLYVAERVIACTEFLSRGKQEKAIGVMDFEGYTSSNAPPLWTMKDSIVLLQTHYPERLKTAIITEPAFWMRASYNMIYPLMSEDTREKIQMAYGEDKYETIRKMIEPEQAMPFMMPGGQLESTFEVDKFLNEVPFYGLYDA